MTEYYLIKATSDTSVITIVVNSVEESIKISEEIKNALKIPVAVYVIVSHEFQERAKGLNTCKQCYADEEHNIHQIKMSANK